jgi:hypothetical protein
VLVNDHLAPAFERLGLRGAGREWSLRSDEYWAQLSIAVRGDAISRDLFIHLSVVAKDEWKRYRPGQPKPHPRELVPPPVGWVVTLGELMPGRPIRWWWTIRAGTDVSDVAREMIDAVSKYAVPAMNERLSVRRHS